jgi:hypothetical protein
MMSRITRFRRSWVAGLRHSRARQRDGDLMTLLSNAIAPGRGAADAGRNYPARKRHEQTLKVPRKTPSFIAPGEAPIFNRNGLQVAVVKDSKAKIRETGSIGIWARKWKWIPD